MFFGGKVGSAVSEITKTTPIRQKRRERTANRTPDSGEREDYLDLTDKIGERA